MGREVAESCVDTMLMEMVAMYSGRFYANKPELAARRIEAIGYQVGHQLSERFVVVSLHLIIVFFRSGSYFVRLFSVGVSDVSISCRSEDDGEFILLAMIL